MTVDLFQDSSPYKRNVRYLVAVPTATFDAGFTSRQQEVADRLTCFVSILRKALQQKTLAAREHAYFTSYPIPDRQRSILSWYMTIPATTRESVYQTAQTYGYYDETQCPHRPPTLANLTCFMAVLREAISQKTLPARERWYFMRHPLPQRPEASLTWYMAIPHSVRDGVYQIAGKYNYFTPDRCQPRAVP